jgi:hypothetical protein
VFQDDDLDGRELSWRAVARYAALPAVLARFIGGFLCPDRRSRGFSYGWGRVLESMVRRSRIYAWGSCLLAHLYRELHLFVYRGSSSLAADVTLLQIWAWEHIAVARPLTHRQRPEGRPYSHMYCHRLVQRKLCKLEYWRQVFDDLDTVIWLPYVDCERSIKHYK